MKPRWHAVYRDYDPTPGDLIVFESERIVTSGRDYYDGRGAGRIPEFSRSNGPFILLEARHRPTSNSWVAVVTAPGSSTGTIEWPVAANILLHRCKHRSGEVD